MIAKFYKNASDERRVNKDIRQIGGEQDIYFKDDTDLVSPVLKVTGNLSADINYLYIQDLGRYYYIRDREFSKQCIYLTCEVDTLMSFRSEMRQMDAIISRNERLYNLYLNDDKMEMYNYPYYQTINMRCTEGTPFSMGTNQILLALVGAI